MKINLEIAGVTKDISELVSKYIIVSFQQKNKLLLTGRYSDEVADAIAATICGMTADVISITASDVDMHEVIEQIEQCRSQVVLIENIASLNETITLQLLKRKFDKHILFSSEILESLNFIPSSLLTYYNLLYLDYVCERPLQNDFVATEISELKLDIEYRKHSYRENLRELEQLPAKSIQSKVHGVVKAELIALIDSFDSDEEDGIHAWLLFEAIPYQILTENREIAEEIIELIAPEDPYVEKLEEMMR